MSNTDIEKFLELIEKDIKQLVDYINENNVILPLKKSTFDILNFSLLIDFKYFKEIIEKKCYVLRSPINPTAGTELNQRFILFNSIFLSRLGDIQDFTIHKHWSRTHLGDFEQSLFLNLLFTILRKHLITGNEAKDIFLDFLEEWNISIKTEKFPIKFLIQMPNIDVTKDTELLKDKIYVKAGGVYTLISNSISSKVHNAILVYKTEIPFKIYTSVQDHNSHFPDYDELFNNEWETLKKEIQDIIFTFYLNNVDFEYQGFIEDYPWWFQFEHEKYFEKIDSYKSTIRFTEDITKSIVKLYLKVVKSNLFKDENFITVSHHYMQLHNRDFFPDIILDAFILFEFLFSKKSKEDIVFQLSFNAGLFLADTPDKFLDIFKFIKKTYGIRSALIHGDKWYDKLNKFFRKSPTINNKIELIYELKKNINTSLKKLIELKEIQPDILADINQINKQSNKIRKAEYLQHLGIDYEKKKEYSDALKMYIEALKITNAIKDEKNADELLNIIKEIYDKSKKIIIFSDELNKFIEELKVIIRVKGEKSGISKQLLDEIKAFKNRSSKGEGLDSEQEIGLVIDGNDIMKILNIKPSKKVGEIKKLLANKVLNGELKNQKEELTSFIESLK